MNNRNPQRNRRRGFAYEREVLAHIGAYRHPMSGASAMKGDGVLHTEYGDCLVECKYQKKRRDHMQLLYAWVTKAQEDANIMQYPYWIIVFRAAYVTKSFFLTDTNTLYTFIPNPYIPRMKHTDHRTVIDLRYGTDLFPLIPASAVLQITFRTHNWTGYVAPIELLPPPVR
ncbi:MAG: hypothetical protein D6823_03240 [Chloroflexi bacterium]|nr:MAG: hypothetical protein D6823_03240 [Chloroflexota bacterium]